VARNIGNLRFGFLRTSARVMYFQGRCGFLNVKLTGNFCDDFLFSCFVLQEGGVSK